MTDFTKGAPIPPTLQAELAGHAEAAELERMWHLLDAAPPVPSAASDADREALWDRIASATFAPTSVPASISHTAAPVASRGWRSRRGGLALAIAASMAVMLTWGAGEVRITTEAGQTRRVQLRDGSTVALNGASELRHPRVFRPTWLGGDGQRTVRLRGEGYFRVAKGEAPFVVRTAHADVRVVGTRFNVQARAIQAGTVQDGAVGEAARTDVTVEEGVVQVQARRRGATSGNVVVLRANEHVTVDGARTDDVSAALQVTRADAQRDLAWTNGGFAAVERPLREVLASLEAQYGVELSMRDSVAAAASITLYYPERTTIDRILNDLSTARGWTMRRTSRGYELRVVK